MSYVGSPLIFPRPLRRLTSTLITESLLVKKVICHACRIVAASRVPWKAKAGFRRLSHYRCQGIGILGARSNVMAAVHGKNSQASFDKALVNIATHFTQPNLMNPIYQTQVALVII